MKNFIVYGLSFLLLFFWGCKKESPTSPQENIQTPDVIIQNIGSSGGKISSDSIEVNFPENTFTANSTVKLSVSETQSSNLGEAISKSYRLEGIPSDYYQPIEIKIKMNRSITSDVFIAIGSEDIIKSKNHVDFSYQLFNTQIQNENVICQLPVPDQGIGKIGKVSSGTIDIILEAVIGKSYTSNQGHFLITYPKTVDQQNVIQLAGYLEEAYNKISSIGFVYNLRTKWPVKVTVRRLKPEDYGYSVSSVWGHNYGYLEFNSTKLNDAEAMRLTAGHEFFHLVQALYDRRDRFSVAKFAAPHLWIDEASAVWAEEIFTNQASYSSPIRDGHLLAPFKGMQTGPNSDAQSYGYGMSSLIKYFGEDKLISIYERIRSGSHPVEAINLSTSEPASFYWKDFLNKYVQGEIYDDVRPLTLASDGATNLFDISTKDDTLKVFQSSCSDLSGILYNIKLRYSDLENEHTASLELTANPNLSLLLYKYKGTSIELIGESSNEISVNNLKSLRDDGWYLLAIVVNSKWQTPFTGQTQVNLKVSIKKSEGIDFSKYKFCQIGLFTPSILIEESNGGTSTSTRNLILPMTKTEGSFSGNTFKAVWDIQSYPKRKGELTITVDPVTLMATTYSVSEIIDDNASITTIQISGNNIQLEYFSSNQPVSLSGNTTSENVCNSISNFVYNIESKTSGYWAKSKNLSCTSQTSLVIAFREY